MTNPSFASGPSDAGSASGPEARGNAGLSEFFRYHGAWAPGVRLFRAVGFQAKAAIIAATFLLPIGVLGWNYFTSQADQIAFSAKEHLGVRYAQALMPILNLLQRERLFATQAAVKGTETPALSEVRAAIRAQWPRLEAEQKAHGEELGTGKAFGEVLQAGQAAGLASGSAEKVFTAHSARIQALLNLLGDATDGSNLTLDPDIDTYFLMDVAMARLPVMLESAAEVRGYGAAMLASGAAATPQQTRRILEQLVGLNLGEAAVETDLAKASAYNAAVATSVKSDAAKTATQAFARQVDATVLRPEGLQGDAAAHVTQGDLSIDSMARLAADASVELDALLAARVARLESGRNQAALITALGLLAALYPFMAFKKVLDGGLREVAFHIHAMRDGDLTTRPRAWGADEAARLMSSLVEMQTSLRRIVSRVRGTADRIVGASAEIASGASDLSARTEQSAASLEQTASAMEEISATVRQGEATVQEASRLAQANAQSAQRGGAIIDEVVQTMQGINQSSSRIGEIIGTIEGIAFQTNILALNAAVEAARAGEQGRGFAVVAAEVRALAQRSSAAAREIKTLITASVEQVETGARVVRQAGETIGEVVGSSQRVSELLAAVSVGAREQSTGVAQSTLAVQGLDTATQQNAALVEETAAAADALRDQARELAGEVSQFRLPPA